MDNKLDREVQNGTMLIRDDSGHDMKALGTFPLREQRNDRKRAIPAYQKLAMTAVKPDISIEIRG